MKRKRKNKLRTTFCRAVLIISLCVLAVLVGLRAMDLAPAAPVPHESGGMVLPEQTPPEEAPPEETLPPLSQEDYSDLLRISELMGKNRATLLDASGKFSDYVELENCSDRTVELSGWALSQQEGERTWTFPPVSLAPGEFLTVFCGGEGELNASFSLSQGDTVYLIAPSGQTVSSLLCSTDEAGVALVLGEDGQYRQTGWASPGYPNTREGYDAFCASSVPAGPVAISEVMSANSLYAIQPDMEGEDWVELKNISGGEVDLSGWHLSDKHKDYAYWALPDRVLQPGEKLLVYCSGSEENSTARYIHAPFSLDARTDQLYLTGPDGALSDYVQLHDIPANGSMGRMDGAQGFFYFATPSPLEDNAGGARFVSAVPEATPDGTYNDTQSLSVELRSPGVIYYTTDGSVPTTSSALYEGPITVDKTTIVRAIAQEEGGLMSPVATYSYFLNENHTLPVLSLVVDNRTQFDSIYRNKKKYVEIPANAAFYDDENSSFNHRCAVSLKGWTSRDLPKKSLGLDFGGLYGGDLMCDIFDNGIMQYGSLSVRAGQDYTSSIFRNELFEELALEMFDKVYTQYSKYCILYINGEYRGIYCLKEDFSRQYYASRNGVDKDSVTMIRTPAALESDFVQEVVTYGWNKDLSKEENYQYICNKIDIDSLIDWFIIEGYSANTDLQGNARVFRSDQEKGKWSFAAYDFDWAFYYTRSDFTIILQQIGNAGNQIPPLIKALLKNPDFRQRFLARFSELNQTILSNEHVIAKIDELEALLEPEVPRDRERWGGSLEAWKEAVQGLRDFILDLNWDEHNVSMLDQLIDLTDEEMKTYFSHIGQ